MENSSEPYWLLLSLTVTVYFVDFAVKSREEVALAVLNSVDHSAEAKK